MSKEQRLLTDVFGFFDDPLSFVLYAFPWGVKGTLLEDFPEGPDEWHLEMFDNMQKRPLQLSLHCMKDSAFLRVKPWHVVFLLSVRQAARSLK